MIKIAVFHRFEVKFGDMLCTDETLLKNEGVQLDYVKPNLLETKADFFEISLAIGFFCANSLEFGSQMVMRSNGIVDDFELIII